MPSACENSSLHKALVICDEHNTAYSYRVQRIVLSQPDAAAYTRGYGPSTQPIEWDYFNCNGAEKELSECNRAVGPVCAPGQFEMAYVICSKEQA